MVVLKTTGTATEFLYSFGEGTTGVDVNWEPYAGTTVTVRKRKLVNTTTSTSVTKATWLKWNGIEVVADAWDDIETTIAFSCTGGTWGRCERYSDGGILPTLEDKLSEIIRKRQAPHIIIPKKGLDNSPDIREMRARETLRRVLGEEKYRLYLKKGFVTVTAKSGLTYQIDAKHITKVWDCGTLVDRLCIYLQGNFPPTDSVIVKYLLVLNNEEQYRSLAIKHTVTQPAPKLPMVEVAQPSLVDLFKDLKHIHGRRRKKAA